MKVRRILYAVVAVATLWLAPSLLSLIEGGRFYLVFLYSLFFWIAQASSWNILGGFAGYVSFGQGAFVGIGAYTAVIMAQDLGVPFFLTLPLAAAAGALFAALAGAIAFLLRPMPPGAFTLFTLILTLLVTAIVRAAPAIDGGGGRQVPVPDFPEFLGEDYATSLYRLGLLVMLLGVGASAWVFYSRFGWALFAIRDQERAAAELGISVGWFKFGAFAIGGAIGALTSAVNSVQVGYLTVEEVFSITVPLTVIVMAVIGGTRHWMGPVAGAVFIYTVESTLLTAVPDAFSQLLLGALLIVAIVTSRKGIFDRIREAPILSASALVGSILLISVLSPGSPPLDRIAYGMLVTLAVLIVTTVIRDRRRRRALPAQSPVMAGGENA